MHTQQKNGHTAVFLKKQPHFCSMPLHILGIRHHGVGSARNVAAALLQLQPDIVLVEGAPELTPLLSWVGHAALHPPVALLGYNIQAPQQAVFYPFVHFSPEWQAIQYANTHRVPVRALDMPLAIRFQDVAQQLGVASPTEATHDPLQTVASIEGYPTAAHWWEARIEALTDTLQPLAHFEAIMLLMETLRTERPSQETFSENTLREAYMRAQLRQVQRELYSTIVVVCGAWHAPALRDPMAAEKADEAMLKRMPKSKISIGATWIPWTYERLSIESGYGAGLTAPGWYAHQWEHPTDEGARWLSRVAQWLRDRHIDASTAHVIEALQLARALSALRQNERPNLDTLQEAVQAVMCMGDGILLELIRQEMIVGHATGRVPDQLPKVPLQADFEQRARKASLALKEALITYTLDLRKPTDLQRSILLHSTNALNMTWATPSPIDGKGTFKEQWTTQWQPEQALELIDKAPWGNSIEVAASNWLEHNAALATTVTVAANLLAKALLAELWGILPNLTQRLETLAADATDVADLMDALLPLLHIQQYGNVRKTQRTALVPLTESLAMRVCLGLPNALYGLSASSAQPFLTKIPALDAAFRALDNATVRTAWQHALFNIADLLKTHGAIAGLATRLLFDRQWADTDWTVQRFGRALSAAQPPSEAAAWAEGFLTGSSMLLLYDAQLWGILCTWLANLPVEQFMAQLPVLRRTFARFTPAERRQLGEKAKKGGARIFASDLTQSANLPTLDKDAAEQALLQW